MEMERGKYRTNFHSLVRVCALFPQTSTCMQLKPRFVQGTLLLKAIRTLFAFLIRLRRPS